jgi:Myb-like DNA-binding domain
MFAAAANYFNSPPRPHGDSSTPCSGHKSLERDALDAILMLTSEDMEVSSSRSTSVSSITSCELPTSNEPIVPPVSKWNHSLPSSSAHEKASLSARQEPSGLSVLLDAVQSQDASEKGATKMSTSYLARRRMARRNKRFKSGTRPGHWTDAEDLALLKTVTNFQNEGETFGWNDVASLIPNRDNEQCRNRWRYHVNPALCNEPFSDEECRFFLEYQREHGNRWTGLGQLMKGR